MEITKNAELKQGTFERLCREKDEVLAEIRKQSQRWACRAGA